MSHVNNMTTAEQSAATLARLALVMGDTTLDALARLAILVGEA